MAKLYGKYKLQDWIEVEKTNPASQRTEQEQKKDILSEYKEAFGQGWMFEWRDE